MSENIIPEELNNRPSDVVEEAKAAASQNVEQPVPEAEPVVADAVVTAPEQAEPQAEAPELEANHEDPAAAEEEKQDLSGKTLAELSEMFQSLKDAADSMMRSKEAESIKSAFYKLLGKLKSDNSDSAEAVSEDAEAATRNNPFDVVEQNFKALYADYKKERAEFNKQQEAQREEKLASYDKS